MPGRWRREPSAWPIAASTVPSMTSNPRPVLALDVDGVLNFDTAPDAHTIAVSADDQPTSPFVRGGGTADSELSINIDPGLGAWITAMREHADVVWATTWEHMANVVLAPLLGIDPLPVACSVATHYPRFGYVKDCDSAAWKSAVLSEVFTGRPLVWVDDSARRWSYINHDEIPVGRGWADWRTDGRGDGYAWYDEGLKLVAAPALVVVPDPDTGLTVEHRDTVERFLVDPYAWAPPAPPAIDW